MVPSSSSSIPYSSKFSAGIPCSILWNGALCAALLARAHGQSPASTAIVGYLGRSEQFAEATAGWSAAYADIAEADFEQLGRAVASGRLPAETGV